MADYIASALLAAQVKIRKGFNDPELRRRQNPILSVGLGNQDFLMVNPKSIKESEKRPVKGYQFTRMPADNGTARSHNFTGPRGDTMEVDLNWGTYTENFSLYRGSGSDNIFTFADMLVNQLAQKQAILRERMGKDLVTNLHAGRTTIANAVVRNATFNATTDAFEITNQEQFFAYVKSVLSQHKYPGEIDLMVDSVLSPIANKIAAQGTQNGTNTAYSLQGIKNILTHDILGTEVAVAGYANGAIGIALPANSFAFIPWLPERYIKGWGDADTVNGAYSAIPDDSGLPINYSLRVFAEKADGSASGGTVDDIKYSFQLGADVATQIAEISTAGESPVYEFALTA